MSYTRKRQPDKTKLFHSISRALISIALSGCVFSVNAHEADKGVDVDDYPHGVDDRWHLSVKHFKYRSKAYQACNEFVGKYGVADCGFTNVTATQLREPFYQRGYYTEGPGEDFYVAEFYYNQYYLEIPNAKSCPAGNPCSLSSGIKTQTETDFANSGINGLAFARTYSSVRGEDGALGQSWKHNYAMSLSETSTYVNKSTLKGSLISGLYDTEEDACLKGWTFDASGPLREAVPVYENGSCKATLDGKVAVYMKIHSAHPYYAKGAPSGAVQLTRANGDYHVFESNGADWINEFNPKLKLTKANNFWTFTNGSGKTERYNADGQLVEIASQGGISQKLFYSLSLAEGGDDNPATLDKVDNGFGQQLLFGYSEEGKLAKVTTPKGEINYLFNEADNISQVTFEDGNSKQYVYENTSWPNHLTGIIDEKNVRYATWDYDRRGRATLSEHAGGAEKVTFEYIYGGTTKTTDALGASRVYAFEFMENNQKIKSVTGDPCQNCGHASYKAQTFNDDGQLATRTDWNGVVTNYEYTNQFLTKKTIAVGTAQEKAILTVWDEDLQLPTKIIEGNKQTTMSYDLGGNLLSQTITDLALAQSRTTSFKYNASGLVSEVDGPREDVLDIIKFEYNAQGLPTKTSNALGHITEITAYDSAGLPLTILHPNNVTELRTYSPRGWLLSQSINGARTQYEYDKVGQVIKITSPSNVTQQFEYDDARRLTAVIDNAGNRTEYTVDLAGNVTQTQIKKADGTVTFTQSDTYDKLSQLVKTISGQGVENTFEYDARGSLIKDTNGLLASQTSSLDALGQLKEMLDPIGGTTQFTYDDLGNTTSVTDAESKATTYEYNAFGEVTKRISPDTGVTTFTYDAAGNVLTKTDAKNITVTYIYDALNRILSESYADTSETKSYLYDGNSNGNKGIGRLIKVNEPSGSTEYIYDVFGNVTQETRVVNGQTYLTEYQFNTIGQLVGMVYPSGQQVSYTLDAQGRVKSLNANFGLSSTTLISNVDHLPFGPQTSLSFGNGLELIHQYDLDYRLIKNQVVGLQDLNYQYDLTNNVNVIGESINQSNQIYSFDKQSRLTKANGDYGVFNFDYDLVGNRLLKNTEASTQYNETPIYPNWSLDARSGTRISIDGMTVSVDKPMMSKNHIRMDTVIKQGSKAYLGEFQVDDASKILVGLATEDFDFLSLNEKHYLGSRHTDESLSSISYWGNYYGKGYVFQNDINGAEKSVVKASNNSTIISLLVDLESTPNNIVFWENGNEVGQYTIEEGRDWFPAISFFGSYTTTSATANLGEQPFIYEVPEGYSRGAVDLTPYETPELNSNYNYNFASKLNGIGGANDAQFTYDENGNTLQKGGINFRYNQANRLSSATNGTTNATYTYNAKGERSIKVVNGYETHYVYDLNGLLISEADSNGNITKEYVYFNGQPLAQIVAGNIYYYHNSHLGTPETLTDANQTIVWRASYTPFGKATIEVGNVENNIRFPGQYYDAETGLHYNYFRDYDPEIGRYIQSDPIGLAGGINTYGYVAGNPINDVDPKGLCGLNMRCWYNMGQVAAQARFALLLAQAEQQAAAEDRLRRDLGLPRFEPSPFQFYDPPVPGVIPGTTESLGPIEIDPNSCSEGDGGPDDGCLKQAEVMYKMCLAGNGGAMACKLARWVARAKCITDKAGDGSNDNFPDDFFDGPTFDGF